MRFLEDRRVLYNPFAWEEPGHCVDSVLLGNLPPTTSELAPYLKAIRGACRKFLDAMQDEVAEEECGFIWRECFPWLMTISNRREPFVFLRREL